tara:strand:- start:3511 stop:4854 length:1344 start_codon:yes stop_codon:yes gene_type:complete
MFKKILIANRGEIAVRVIRACRSMGIATVAVYSEADSDALHTHIADQSICIGPPSSADSYLNIANIISAAVTSGAEAIHPGAGFLAENPYFADVCSEYDICFIGPSPNHLTQAGDKSAAIRAARNVDIPTLRSTGSALDGLKSAREEIDDIGLPVMLKAVAGGGGRGMRRIHSISDLTAEFNNAQAEAKASFGNSGLYLERLLTNARHVEVQILGDGNEVIHLYDRDCSVQRRHQKVIEEGKAPSISAELREDITGAAVKLAKSLNYVSAGTVEFLVDSNDNYHFIELNARIQVEHPVTEMITGVDIVKQQIMIASGEPLTITQEDVKTTGHAIECRLVAEDSENNWVPAAGMLQAFNYPQGPGIRVDTHVYSGYEIPPQYDSLLAKIICWGKDRESAVNLMEATLEGVELSGVRSNLPYLKRVILAPQFRTASHDLDSNLGLANMD